LTSRGYIDREKRETEPSSDQSTGDFPCFSLDPSLEPRRIVARLIGRSDDFREARRLASPENQIALA